MRFAALALIASATLHAADYKDVNKTVALNPTGSVTVETHKGSIHASTWDRPEVDVKARIEAEDAYPMDRRQFEGTEVLIDSSPDSVRIRTKYPDSWCCSDGGNNPAVRYTIQLPRTARLTIRDHRSDTVIADLQGALDITTHRGTVQAHRLSGPVQLNTHRGEVKIDFAAFTGNSSIETHRGSIELELPRNSKFDIQTDAGRHSSVESDFTMMMRSAGHRGESLHGAVNGGGPSLRLNTFRGHIRIRAM